MREEQVAEEERRRREEQQQQQQEADQNAAASEFLSLFGEVSKSHHLMHQQRSTGSVTLLL